MAALISEHRDYSISRVQVSYDLKKIKQRWLKSELVDYHEVKSKELAKVDQLEQTYWEAWEDSRQTKEITSTKRTTGGKDTKDEAGIRREQQTGNPAYLSGVQWCISKRCDIFGLDTPKQVDLTWREELEKAGYNATEAFEQLVNAIAASRRDTIGGDVPRSVEGSEAP